MSRPRAPILTEEDRLATRKLADRYVNRKGGAPSMMEAAKAARHQDLNDDDRRHLKFCLKTIRKALTLMPPGPAEACMDFVEALLDRDYRLHNAEARRQEDENAVVSERDDPELYDHMMRKRR